MGHVVCVCVGRETWADTCNYKSEGASKRCLHTCIIHTILRVWTRSFLTISISAACRCFTSWVYSHINILCNGCVVIASHHWPWLGRLRREEGERKWERPSASSASARGDAPLQSSCRLQERSRPAVATDWLVDDERHLVAAGVGQQHQMDYARKGTGMSTKIVRTHNTHMYHYCYQHHTFDLGLEANFTLPPLFCVFDFFLV